MSRRSDVLLQEVDQVVRDVVLNRIVASGALPRRLRNPLMRKLGHDVHPTALINPGAFLGAWSGLTLKERSFVNYGCFLDLGAEITLGRYSGIGYETMLITCGHHIGPEWNRIGAPDNAPIVIEDGCWVGSRVMVMPGVTIGEGCVVASGSVVTKDCEPNSLYAGVPASYKRSIAAGEASAARAARV
ncbi:acyltransferase [Rhodococcoides yunnanense]|uniref:acyltransferase n=1 Tax=Rhodococcoides yunnanense TaxID=278209 RepID=UPI0009338E32|nr:acyltransferase [Rhodococcus yunnanensis]